MEIEHIREPLYQTEPGTDGTSDSDWGTLLMRDRWVPVTSMTDMCLTRREREGCRSRCTVSTACNGYGAGVSEPHVTVQVPSPRHVSHTILGRKRLGLVLG